MDRILCLVSSVIYSMADPEQNPFWNSGYYRIRPCFIPCGVFRTIKTSTSEVLEALVTKLYSTLSIDISCYYLLWRFQRTWLINLCILLDSALTLAIIYNGQ